MDGQERVIGGMTKAERDALIKRSKAREAERVAAMLPEERAKYDERKKEEEAYSAYMAEQVLTTRGELEMQEANYAGLLDEVASDRDFISEKAEHATINAKNARTHQSAQDKKIAELEKRLLDADGFEVEELETENGDAKLTPEEVASGLPPEALSLILAERTAAARGKGRTAARTHQSTQDKKIKKLEAKIEELEAKVAELTEERDELLKRLLLATGAKATA